MILYNKREVEFVYDISVLARIFTDNLTDEDLGFEVTEEFFVVDRKTFYDTLRRHDFDPGNLQTREFLDALISDKLIENEFKYVKIFNFGRTK